MQRNRLTPIAGLLAAAALAASAPAAAVVVHVDPTASGLFGHGHVAVSGTAMVNAVALAAGAQAAISASGALNTGTHLILTPDGITAGLCCGEDATTYLPLEEAAADAGTLDHSGNFVFTRIGGLLGAFVPAAIAGGAGFTAVDTDLGGGIASSAVFFIGAGPFSFTAPEDGVLFLGVNDWYSINNTGPGYDVAINVKAPRAEKAPAVPAPAVPGLLALGATLLGLLRRRGTSA